jgi:hypothetical protein
VAKRSDSNLYPRPIAAGTVIWTSPTGHTFPTTPGSKRLFPTLCLPTGELRLPQHDTTIAAGDRGVMMPKRRRTRAENLAKRIEAKHKPNDEYVAERNDPPPF